MPLEKVSCMGLQDCIKLSNGDVDVIVTTSVGPRILYYGASGGRNVLGQFPDSSKETALGTWKPYGGHRLWVWPEVFPGTYAPDNAPIEHESEGDLALVLRQPADAAGMEKQIRLTLASSGSGVQLEHTVTSHSYWPVDIAVWAVSIVQSGVGILPRVPFQTHDEYAAATQPLALCSYTDLEDPRFTLGLKYILLRADPSRSNSQKIGLRNKEGWCAHLAGGTLFVKRFAHENRAAYPDYGVNCEIYVEGSFMEIELLGPRQIVWPGESIRMREEWNLFEGVQVSEGARDPEELDRALAPHIRSLF